MTDLIVIATSKLANNIANLFLDIFRFVLHKATLIQM